MGAGRRSARRGLEGGQPDRLDRLLGLFARARPPQPRHRARMGRRHGGLHRRRALRLPRLQFDPRSPGRRGRDGDGRPHPAAETAAAGFWPTRTIAAKAAAIPAASAPAAERKRLKELAIACCQAAHLGRYYAERFLSAWRSGQAEAGHAGRRRPGLLPYAGAAERAWASPGRLRLSTSPSPRGCG